MMLSTKYFSCLTLACLAVLTFYASPSMACGCSYVHPQDRYCNAKYFAHVFIKEKRKLGNNFAFDIDVYKFYKETPEGKKALKDRVLTTAPQDGLCGVNLEKGKFYVIGGQGSELNVCYSYVKEYKSLTAREFNFISEYYPNSSACKCKVNTCTGSTSNKEELEDKICHQAYVQGNSGPIQCMWGSVY